VTTSPPTPTPGPIDATRPDGTATEIFGVFLKLGLTAFGGPIAHVGYLRQECVQRRRWLDEAQFAQLLAVCQCVPGPASSQMGFAIGLFRAGWRGAVAAFVAFTLPSALLMFGAAALASRLDHGMGAAVVHGLKLVAVAVVAHGLVNMARQLAPDAPRALIAAAACALIVLAGGGRAQLAVVAFGGALGLWLCRDVSAPAAAVFPVRYGSRRAAAFLLAFLIGLGASLVQPSSSTATMGSLASAFYQTGALVFGGGHVVLPLLQQAVVDTGWVDPDTFLAGYGSAQAMPGPMFSVAAFLGAEVPLGLPAAAGAAVALLALFLPGFLLLLAVLPVWSGLARRRWAASAMAGINAAVVGLLAAAFHDPVWRQGVHTPGDVAIAVVGFTLLAILRVSALWVVLWAVGAAIAVRQLL
jgi:chromate transporter